MQGRLNYRMISFDFYNWQIKAFNAIKDRNAVLSSPTGSGKTLVAYLWAGLVDLEGKVIEPQDERIIFTAPIKALSNERYLDLRRMGFDVGIETGDFKRNTGAPLLCCTQEIYTLKYSSESGQKLVVDEFHYIFTDPQRARAYIDGIRGTHPSTKILVMSATFGGTHSVGNYLSRITGEEFTVYENHERATKLVFQKKHGSRLDKIHDALVFLFSQKGAAKLALRLSKNRKRIKRDNRKRLYEIAKILDVPKVMGPLLRGVGVYHGGMLPKEKLLVESAFRERIIDVVVGTNALALGVNLPAEYAIFAQLVMYHDEKPISKNEFSQMAGRAGRKGLFDTGYVSWLTDSPFEHRRFNTGWVFRNLVRAQPEDASVTLRPAYGELLRREVTIDDEAHYIAAFSLPTLNPHTIGQELRENLKTIDRTIRQIVSVDDRSRFRRILADIWYEEMDVEENLEMANLFLPEERPDALFAADIISYHERNYLQSLLRVKRYANRLPQGYSFKGLQALDATINNIDGTIFGFEEIIDEIEETSL